MVTRKPVPPTYNASTAEKQDRLPYPASPASASEQTGHQHSFPSMLDTGEGWEEVGVEGPYENSTVPHCRKAGDTTGQGANALDVPALLRVGRPETASTSSFGSQSSAELFPPSSDIPQESLRDQSSRPAYSTNPYRNRSPSADRIQNDMLQSQEQSSVDIWAELEPAPPQPTHAPPPLPIPQDIGGFGDLSIPDHQSYAAPQIPPVPQQHPTALHNEDPTKFFSDNEQYQSEVGRQTSPFGRDAVHGQADNLNDQTGWSDHEYQHLVPEQPATHSTATEDNGYSHLEYAPPSGPPPSHPGHSHQDLSAQIREPVENSAPELPARRSQEVNIPPPQPARAPPNQASAVAGGSSASRPDAESPQAKAKRQRSETYQIKHVNWVDSSNNARTSPIMVQNANGPCPLLALVNALTLSTPVKANTALVETLRVREQVSLGLLLDAVFDELMSGRRGDAAQELPDVGELYTFLITLHTGMNVNPRFVTDPTSPDLMDFGGPTGAISQSGHPQPGGFEETKEMKLYSTFNVPLIHGWLPPRSNPAYDALQRSAKTYEDAQNLMFREEELEDKLQRDGLSFEEQRLLGDITSIKYFLQTSATQLTTNGLKTITENLRPGSVAILFRNDHFSTVYKHPRSGNLLNLVTDMGYAGHPEVVWESLIDVSGEGSSFFAGDFRPVGNNTSDPFTEPQSSAQDNSQGWETVPAKNRNKQPLNHIITESRFSSSSSGGNSQQLPMSPNTEQEDHDLALALQLQEEEEDRSRRETAQRRHEDQLSRAYLSSETPPPQPPRNNTTRPSQTAQSIRPMVPPRTVAGPSNPTQASRRAPPARHDPEAGEDAPPPSYEQAAKSEPYIPQPGQPFPPPVGAPVPGMNVSNPTVGIRPPGGRPRQASAYSTHATSVGNLNTQSVHRNSVAGQRGGGLGGLPTGAGIARRRSAGVQSEWNEQREGRDKDCVVM
ncbi:hypothetical protein MMC30_001337 [Trapelia coarctata]|nr:hypothetical protein [Trapelia coarctata]